MHIYIEGRRQEGERFINYVDSFFERLDSYNPYFDLEILIIHNLTYQHYIDRFNFRTKFLPSILLSPPIGENRNLCTIIRKRSKLSSIRNSMYPQARGPANRYPFIIIYLERIARQDFFRYPDNRPGNR